MDIEEHHKLFLEIIDKYDLKSNADILADYVTHPENHSAEEFSKTFNIPLADSNIFLSFVEKGLKLKENMNI